LVVDHISSSLIGRKARKEAYTLSKRVEDFASENLFILGGFTGFYLLGKPCARRKIFIFNINNLATFVTLLKRVREICG
jgi:hypothetical protein